MRFHFYIFLLWTFQVIHAQEIYKPLPVAKKEKQNLIIEKLDNKLNSKLKNISKQFSGKKKKLLKKMYEAQFEDLLIDINKGELYLYQPNIEYLYEIFERIADNNPLLEDYDLFIDFSRKTTANAYSVGDGFIIINFYLLNFLEKEDELASIIAHEIAHDILHHRDKSFNEWVDLYISKDYKKRQKSILKENYGRQQKAEKFLKNIIYTRKHKSRKQEYEADSLGLILLNNSGYNPDASIRSLQIMDSVDIEKDSIDDALLRKYFHTSQIKFDKNWLFQEDFSGYVYKKDKKWNQDSLKTHPDCKNRIIKLNKIKSTLNPIELKKPVNQQKFNELKKIVLFESIYNYYYFEDYGYGLYHNLLALKKYPGDKFLLKMFGKFLKKLSEAKKNMNFNHYVPSLNPPEQTKSFQLFVNFMYNIPANELSAIGDNYLNNYYINEKHPLNKN